MYINGYSYGLIEGLKSSKTTKRIYLRVISAWQTGEKVPNIFVRLSQLQLNLGKHVCVKKNCY